MRIPTEDIDFPISVVEDVVTQLQKRLLEMEANKDIILSDDVKKDALEVIHDGVVKVGKFHIKKPLAINKQGDIYSRDFALLYYYHNRMQGYELEKYVDWGSILNS